VCYASAHGRTDYVIGAEGHLMITSDAPTCFVRKRKGETDSIVYNWPRGHYSYQGDEGERAGHLKEYTLGGDRHERVFARVAAPERLREIAATEERQDAASDAIDALETALNERLLAAVEDLPRIEVSKLFDADGGRHCLLGNERRLFVTEQRPSAGTLFPSGQMHLTWPAYEYNHETERTVTDGVVDEYVSRGTPIRYISRVATEPVVKLWEEAAPALAAARAEWTAARAAHQAALLALVSELPRVRTRELVAKRAAHAREKLAEHEQKLAREERLVRAWARKVTYYARKGV
jgi:hypothetical protein